ncbi:MAG: Imm53 family immunity protein, partial [Pseudomonadales bacterium]
RSGISVDTMSRLKIEIRDNPIFPGLHIPYKLVEISENDWYGIKVENQVFEAFGDPLKLEFLLNEFRGIVEKNGTPRERV